MTLYLHLDRMGQLKQNDIIGLQRYAGGNALSAFADMFCMDFIRHLDGLCYKGLSYHGKSYLIGHFDPGHSFRADLIMNELYLEFTRWKNGIDAPSRLQSLFAWRDKEDALKSAQDNKAYPMIYEVEALGRFVECDMNLSRRPDCALQYWQGKALCNDESYSLMCECVLELPVRVVRQVKLTPAFSFAE